MRAALFTVLCLLPSLSLGQQVYSWVDKDGEEHFTDDPSTIPAKARKRVTEGDPISVLSKDRPDAGGEILAAEPFRPQKGVRSGPQNDIDAPSSSEVRWRELFRAANARVEQLELQVESDRHQAEDNVIPQRLVCSGLAGSGCMYLPSPELEQARARHKANTAALARARSDLEDLDRRASLGGVPREWRR